MFDPKRPSIFAVGLDKARADPCLIVWDIEAQGVPGSASPSAFNVGGVVPSVQTPVIEKADGEGITALTWIPSRPFSLACGTHAKWIRIYDLRNTERISIPAHNREVLGICFDPLNDDRFASFSEDGKIKVWDMHKLQVPLCTISPGTKSVSQVAWSPTRDGILASVSPGDSTVKLWDVNALSGGTGSGAHWGGASSASVVDGVLSTPPMRVQTFSEPVAGMSWHPEDDSRVVVLSNSGTVEDIQLREPMPLAWSPQNDIIFSLGNNIQERVIDDAKILRSTGAADSTVRRGQKYRRETDGHAPDLLSVDDVGRLGEDGDEDELDDSDSEARSVGDSTADGDDGPGDAAAAVLDGEPAAAERDLTVHDVSIAIADRARRGYGLDEKANMDIAVADGDSTLEQVWRWARGMFKLAGGRNYEGVYQILTQASSAVGNDEPAAPQTTPLVSFPYFNSRRRQLALKVCGWVFHSQQDDGFEQYLQMLEKLGKYEEAAATAIWNMDLERCIEALTRGGEAVGPQPDRDDLSLLAMALAGYPQSSASGGPPKAWAQMCTRMRPQIKHPYARAILTFLSSTSTREFSVITKDPRIALPDRLAFALRFLDDKSLGQFIEEETMDHVERGDLRGMPLTGLTPLGVILAENYVVGSGDVQTAVLLLSLASPRLFVEPRVEYWLEEYRELLNRWQMWTTRAKLDVALGQRGLLAKQPQAHVLLRCTFCNQSLVHGQGKNASRARPHRVGMTAPPTRTMSVSRSHSCSSCSNTLPSCCICLMQLGTRDDAAELAGQDGAAKPGAALRSAAGRGEARTTAVATTHVKPKEGTSFDDWFSWCQHCMHGGHARHLIDWFTTHDLCPVTGCNCQCGNQDIVK